MTDRSRRHSSTVITDWGFIEGWLSHDSSGRGVIINAGPHGLIVTVVDMAHAISTVLDVPPGEDPSKVAWAYIKTLVS